MSTIDYATGFNVIGQFPLNTKTYFKTLSELSDLGTDNVKAFKYEEDMVVRCIENHTSYKWKERTPTDFIGTGLLPNDFIYPTGSVSNGIDYSNRSFNFFIEKLSLGLQDVTDVDNETDQPIFLKTNVGIGESFIELSGQNIYAYDSFDSYSTSLYFENNNVQEAFIAIPNKNGTIALIEDLQNFTYWDRQVDSLGKKTLTFGEDFAENNIIFQEQFYEGSKTTIEGRTIDLIGHDNFGMGVRSHDNISLLHSKSLFFYENDSLDTNPAGAVSESDTYLKIIPSFIADTPINVTMQPRSGIVALLDDVTNTDLFEQTATPSLPSVGFVKLYNKNGSLHQLDNNGNEINLAAVSNNFYEEGIYAPTLASGYTFSTSNCKFNRIGNRVTVDLDINGINGSTGAIGITPPFPINSFSSGSLFQLIGTDLSTEDLNRTNLISISSGNFNLQFINNTSVTINTTFTNGRIIGTISYNTNVY